MKTEIAHLDTKLDRLFELRMSEEISKKEYQLKKAQYNLEKSRLESQLQIKYSGDDGYNATVLNALKILSKAKEVFSSDITPISTKQMLLHFLFKEMTLNEGDVSCILNKPFSFIHSDNVITAKQDQKEVKTPFKTESCELFAEQEFDGNFEGFWEGAKNAPFEPQKILIKQEVRPQNLTSVQRGWANTTSFERLKKHRISIVSCKDCVRYAVERLGLS